MLYCIVKYAKFNIVKTGKTILLITIYSAAMSAVVVGSKTLLKWLIPGQLYLESLVIVAVCSNLGGLVYFAFVYTSGLASDILGDRINRLPLLKKLKR